MNKRELEVEKHKLKEEKKVLNNLKRQYEKAIEDIARKTNRLHKDIQELYKQLDGSANDNIIRSRIQAKVYQKQYQENLMRQVNSAIDKLNKKQYKLVTDYLNSSYETGYIGSMYDMHGQEVPIVAPIDKNAMIKAVTLDAPISNKLYGTYTNLMKKRIASEISRGIAQASTYADIARNLQNIGNAGFNKAMRIVRTEGHKVQCESAFDAQHMAKSKGADVVKQWDSTLDGKTRDSHRLVDGQIRELEEKFSNGLMIPGESSGGASEVVNCRCALMQRAKWALGESELQVLRDRAEFFELDKSNEFDDFKEKYMKIPKGTDSENTRRETKKINTKSKKKKNSIEKTGKINYNNYSTYKAYEKLVKSGELTPLSDFELYEKISSEIDKKIIGIKTANNIKIKSKSEHFIARVIGSVEQRRNGVPIKDVISIIQNPDKTGDVVERKNGKSQKFIKYGVGSVSVNPKTGKLIQVNPLRAVKKA